MRHVGIEPSHQMLTLGNGSRVLRNQPRKLLDDEALSRALLATNDKRRFWKLPRTLNHVSKIANEETILFLIAVTYYLEDKIEKP